MESSNKGPGAAPRGDASLAERIRRALDAKDIEALADLYAEDAVLEEISNLSPPAHPSVASGREAIRARFESEILHDPVAGWSRRLESVEILDALETNEALAFTEVRTYAAGDKAVAQHLARKKGGLIGHDRIVIAWDAE